MEGKGVKERCHNKETEREKQLENGENYMQVDEVYISNTSVFLSVYLIA